MLFFQRVLIGALSLGALVSSGSASVIYNNGSPNQTSGNEMTEWTQSEDFTLNTTQTIGGVKFWDFQNAESYNGSISWFIYSDKSGVPGSILDQGNVMDVQTSTGKTVLSSYSEYENDFSTGNLTLGPGTYHLGLHNGPISDTSRAEFYWETTDSNGTSTGEEVDLQTDTSWRNNDEEHAFELLGTTATPEPSSFLLLGLGGIALGGFRKFRHR